MVHAPAARRPSGSGTAGRSIACLPNTFNPLLNRSDQSACVECNELSTTLGASSVTTASGCYCVPQHFDDRAPAAIAISTDFDGPKCEPCPLGADCVADGITIFSLPLRPGFFRPSRLSTDVRRCPDAGSGQNSACGGSNASADAAAYSICADGLEGTYCKLCSSNVATSTAVTVTSVTDVSSGESSSSSSYSGRRYFIGPTADAPAQCVSCEGLGGLSVLVVALVLLAVVSIISARLLIKKKAPAAYDYANRIATAARLTAMLKILIGYYMIASRVDSVYDVPLPEAVVSLLAFFKVGISLGLDGLTAPFECMGGYATRLGIWLILPPALTALIVLGAAIKKRRDGTKLLTTSLPLVLRAFFLLYPIVTNVAFEAFDCIEFDEGAWLRADVSIDCTDAVSVGGPRAMAFVGILLYPIGMLCFNAFILWRVRKSAAGDAPHTVLSSAAAFLYEGYEPYLFWWELVEMLKRFLLVGLFLLVQAGSLTQLLLGGVACTLFMFAQVQARPFKSARDNSLANSTSVALLLYFGICVVFKFGALVDSLHTIPRGYVVPYTGLTVFAIASLLGSLVFSAAVLSKQMAAEAEANRKAMRDAKTRRLRYTKTGQVVAPPTLTDAGHFHLFLSHTWAQGQSDMRVVKQRLLELMPDVKCFLDVDNLEEGAGAEYIDRSSFVLAFCTRKYFGSRACARELFRAVLLNKPIIALLEPERTAEKGGLTVSECKATLTTEWVQKWKLEGEVAKWAIDWNVEGGLQAPDAAMLFKAIFKNPPIEWNRFTAFQDVSLRLLAERLLPEGHDKVYVTDSATRAATTVGITLVPLQHGRTHHLYISPHNDGGAALGEELKGVVASSLSITQDITQLDQCEHMLLYLTARTWTSGEASEKFAHEVCEAQRKGVHLLLAHEFPSVLEADGEITRATCDFNDMWNDGWTPRWLLKGDANVYKQIATALKGGEWRPAGLGKLASELAKGGGSRERWRAFPSEPGFSDDAARRGSIGGRMKVSMVSLNKSRVHPEVGYAPEAAADVLHSPVEEMRANNGGDTEHASAPPPPSPPSLATMPSTRWALD